MDRTEKSFNEYLQMSIDAGIEPLELIYYPVVDIEEGLPIAYRAKMTIHSIILGDMEEETYIDVSDTKKCSKELLKRTILHAMNDYKAFVKAERNIEFISIRCPSEIITKLSLFDLVSELLNENPWFDSTKLCLEFPESLLKKDYEKTRIQILDMKLLHIKTLVSGCGKDDFLLSKLTTITPDYVLLDPSATSYAGSRNKPRLIPSLVEYIKSMGIKTIAEGFGIYRKLLRNTDCIGFSDINQAALTKKQAVSQKEELYV